MSVTKNHWQEGYLASHSWNPPGTTEYWSGMDDEKTFKSNTCSIYTETSITYTYNSKGFRTKEFNFTNLGNTILCFGCSHTEGIGVQHPWPELLEQKLSQYTVYNLGHGAASGDTVARLITNYVPLLKPKKVFILWPSPARYELYNSQDINFVGPWSENKNLVENLTEENTLNWAEKNKIYVSLFSKVYNFELYEDQADNWMEEPIDRGRDDAHPGPKTHAAITEKFLSLIKC